MTTPTLEARNRFLDRLALRLQRLGWEQCNNGGCDGPNCLNGAIIWCATIPADRPAAHYATQAIKQTLMDEEYSSSIIHWNDIPGRRLEQVVALLERAKCQPFILESKA